MTSSTTAFQTHITTYETPSRELGRDLATTEGEVIFENELLQLIRYLPLYPHAHHRPRPLLMVPSCINKFYLFDLRPDNSLVRFALDHGHDVYMVSWRSADAQTAHLGSDDYLGSGVQKAIEVVLEATGRREINALGMCMGGRLLACAVAALNMIDRQRINSLTLLSTLLDVSATGTLADLVAESSRAACKSPINDLCTMSCGELMEAISSLRIASSHDECEIAPNADLHHWNNDSSKPPDRLLCWYLRSTYQEHRPCPTGKSQPCGAPHDLGRLDMPVYLYASRDDQLTPWRDVYAGERLLNGETTFVLGSGSHLTGLIDTARRNYWMGPHPGRNADAWLKEATPTEGSWWLHWSAWLAAHSGPRVVPFRTLSEGNYRSIEAAPGRYAMTKAG